MSIKLINRVWQETDVKGSELIVLLALADFADDDGYCWPSVQTIADKSRLSKRQTQRVMDSLATAHHIVILDDKGGRGNTNTVQLFPTVEDTDEIQDAKGDIQAIKGDADDTVYAPERVTSETQKGDIQDAKGDIQGNPSIYRIRKDPSEKRNAPARATAKPNVLRVTSPHFNADDFNEQGFVPSGLGTNAVQVYYERADIRSRDARLTAMKEDDLIRLCPDLDRLREVMIAYTQTGYRQGNLRLILDWYREGVPEHQQPKESTNRRMSKIDNNMLAIDQAFAYLEKHGVNPL